MSGRPAQVGIERLPARRMSNEPRESMNCKSCRKRKVSFLFFPRNSSGILRVFPDKVQSVATDLRGLSGLPMPVYLWWGVSSANAHFSALTFYIDAVPKKRGPKTDVLEALLKRVDGLERKLRDEKKSNSPNNDGTGSGSGSGGGEEESVNEDVKPKRPHLETTNSNSNLADESAVYSPTLIRYVISVTIANVLLN